MPSPGWPTKPPTLSHGYHQESHYALRFDGGWYGAISDDAAGGAYRWTDRSDSTLDFTFKGTELDLVAKKGEDLGRFYVTIDHSNIFPNMLPRDGQFRAYVDLTDTETKWQESIPIARGLREGDTRSAW